MLMQNSLIQSLNERSASDDQEKLSARISQFVGQQASGRPRAIVNTATTTALQYEQGIPAVAAENLSSEVLESAMSQDGALLVRGLAHPDTVSELREIVDQVIENCSQAATNGQSAVPKGSFYAPPTILREVMPGAELGTSRGFHHNSGSAMCVEAPSVAEELLGLYKQWGLYELIAAYLNEPPCLSAKKWVLRRTQLPISDAGWHQDGAFMGTDISSLNLWLPLTHCGGDSGAPGLDVVPARLQDIISSDEAYFDWAVSPSTVDREFANTAPISPEFAAGDALFFDHFYLHRTQYKPSFSATRYAIETWFFGSETFPKNQVPLAW